MFGIGPWEMVLIFLVVLLLFGAKRLPDIAQGLGKGIREFKRAMKDTTDEVKGSVDVKPQDPNRIDPPRQDNHPS
ncbi:MAG: twin-arginine translocase TatA/TatE family subunit [candidate division Zixibacteria bacterium]|nr:twin-arginine translocase TatA/TatE family subunit [candidate division Zixibacteria bacterium]